MRRVLIAMLVTLMVSCGKGSDNPAPAPAPTTPAPATPAPATPPSIPGTNCPTVSGGVPIQNNSPFYGNLTQGGMGGYGGYGYPQQTYGGTNSLALSFSTLNQQSGWGTMQNIIGSGQVIIPSIMGQIPTTSPQSYQVCVSSVGYSGGGTLTPGTIDWSRGGSVSITLRGQVQMPYYNPYGGQGPSVNGPAFVEVTLGGYSCPAYLTPSNRIQGCVMVSIGGGQQMMYQSQ